MINTVQNIDCLIGMQNIPDKSISLICIDPPYNIKKAEWDKWETVNSYVEWMGKVFIECQRVLKDNGSFYFFHNDFLQIVELQNWLNKNSKLVFKQLITWNKIHEKFKNNGFVQQRLSIDMMRNYYNGFTEYCLYYTLERETGFANLQNYFKNEREELGWNYIECDNYLGIKASYCYWDKTTSHEYTIPEEKHYVRLQETGRFKKSYSDIKIEFESKRNCFNTAIVKSNLRANSNVWLYPPSKNIGHITPKPVELIENIIEHSSNEDDVILDCFAGSGTTAIACINTNRNYILMEKEEKYYNIILDRIKKHTPQLKLIA